MKRLLPLFLVVAASLLAAPWDGVRGDLTVFTATVDFGPLVSIAPNPVTRFVTMFSVLSANPAVNNVRVTIRYRDEVGNLKRISQDSDIAPNGIPWITVVFPVQVSQIVGEPFIEARAITAVSTFGTKE